MYSFINKNILITFLLKDKKRILEKFQNVNTANICVRQQRTTLKDNYLIKHLFTYGPVILLINSNLLKCDLCKRKQFLKDFYSCMPWQCVFERKSVGNNGKYFSGHFIVLCGYNLNTGKYLYKNPAIKDSTRLI